MVEHETLEQAIVNLWASRGLEVTEIDVKHHPRTKSGSPAHWYYRIRVSEERE